MAAVIEASPPKSLRDRLWLARRALVSTLSSDGVNPRYQAVGEDGSRPPGIVGTSIKTGFSVRMLPSESLRLRVDPAKLPVGRISPNSGLLVAVAGETGERLSAKGLEAIECVSMDSLSGYPLLVTLCSCERARERVAGLGLVAREETIDPGGRGTTWSWFTLNLFSNDLKLSETCL